MYSRKGSGESLFVVFAATLVMHFIRKNAQNLFDKIDSK